MPGAPWAMRYMAYSGKRPASDSLPVQSVVLQVQADLRCITSRTMASVVSLRFPRATGIR